ncbi:MATH domain and coiled-coil domain-containing protein At3g58210-like [Quercus lobata]|uniref:MATH domain and coiled-coil domain-containing protein At3g58210-like n=1 Tax=Quercus lobata TaxID=97700 RepID=UPI001245BEB8|nr:MATH domain and coiled-coil domain-containing protein At3g58210-like [Quercus lobata]
MDFKISQSFQLSFAQANVAEISWRLSLYPKGIEKKNENGHISLYLAIAETEELPLGWEVNAGFRLFVFDQIRDEYLTVQDGGGGGAIKRFNDMNSEWGFAKFLPPDTFNDVTQGYLVNNCCVFGVEVFVHERTVKRQCLSMIEEPDNSTFTWKIERFSTLDEERYHSQEFTVGDSKWKLLVYPKGNSTGKNTALSFFLSSCNCIRSEQNVFAEFTLRIRDQIKGKHKEISDKHWFSTKGWGFPEFLPLKDINDAAKGFLVNDTLLVEAEIIVMSKVRWFSNSTC